MLTSRRTADDATRARIRSLGERVRLHHPGDQRRCRRPARRGAPAPQPCRADLPPLAGIVHAAGENSTTALSELDGAELDRVFAGKVWGAWNLAEAVGDLKLDFFLSTSSISSVWGSYGQSAAARQRLPRRADLESAQPRRSGRQREFRSVVGREAAEAGVGQGPGRPAWPTPTPDPTGTARHPRSPCRRAGRHGRRHGARRSRCRKASCRADGLEPVPPDLLAGRPALAARRGGP